MAERSKRKKWDPHSMKEAVAAVKEKKMGYLKASKFYNVPRSTLENYVNHKSKSVEDLLSTKLGRKSTLGDQMESELVEYCKLMDQRYFGLKLRDVRQLAFQLAVRNNLDHPFSVSKGVAGKKWFYNLV